MASESFKKAERSFFDARENYYRALGKFNAAEKMMFELYGVNNSADLDIARLESRNNGKLYTSEWMEFDRQCHAFDAAATAYDLAKVVQRQKIKEEIDKDFANIDC